MSWGIRFLVGLCATGTAFVAAIGCAVTDISQNLYVFGASYGDINLGSVESAWISSSAPTTYTSLTSLANRPPFDTANPTCSFAPYLDCITVLNGDSSKGMSVLHVFNTTSMTWSIVQLTGTDTPSTTNYVATLDHDTNVIYAYSNGIIYRIDYANSLDKLKDVSSLTLEWLSGVNASAQPFAGSSYTSPVMGQATNHLHFFNQPDLQAGEAWIFVVHYSWWQPTPQSYGTFAQKPGQTVYIPAADQTNVPSTFAYIPDDGTATILVNVNTNTSTTLTGFGSSGSTYRYAATNSYIVQFDTTGGGLKVLPVSGGDVSSGSGVTLLPTASVAAISTQRGLVSTGTAATTGTKTKMKGNATKADSANRYKVIPDGKGTDGAGGIAGTKKRIRDTERLLKKPNLQATVKQDLERKLKALQLDLGAKIRETHESDLAQKYKYVKHVESTKLLRRVAGLEKKIAAMDENSDDRKVLEDELAQQRKMLAYIQFFPKDMKYMSLFAPSNTNTTAIPNSSNNSVDADTLKARIMERVAEAITTGEARKSSFVLRMADIFDDEECAAYLAYTKLGAKKEIGSLRKEKAPKPNGSSQTRQLQESGTDLRLGSRKNGIFHQEAVHDTYEMPELHTISGTTRHQQSNKEAVEQKHDDADDDFFLTEDAEVVEDAGDGEEDDSVFEVERVERTKRPRSAGFKGNVRKGKKHRFL
ncbi:hypothetical protein HDU82_004387 [Entophlyctis luteolus]|nr:hypothetical protein HDU82_004387 [Entophlyctis luteolus]